MITSAICGRWRLLPTAPGGTPTSPARPRTSPRRSERKIASTRPWPTQEVPGVKAIKEAGGIDDPILARAIDVLYLAYLEKQVDPALLKKIIALANAVEKEFNVYRAKVDGKEMTDSRGPQGAEELQGFRTPARRSGRRARRSAQGGRGRPARNWSSCATRRPHSSASRITTPCSFTSTSRTATRSAQAVRRARRADARAVRGRQGGDRRRSWPRIAASRSRS